MRDAPDVDGRNAAAIREHVAAIAPYYLSRWDLEAGGVGAGTVEIFSEMAADLTERLDAAPSKHRIAFFEALGFGVRPPDPARVPIQFLVDENAPRSVAVRPGTEAIAQADEEVSFRIETGEAFEAIPARLTHVFAVDPAADAIYDHSAVVDGDRSVLFDGENVQEHACYVGDEKLLAVGENATVRLLLDTDADPAVIEALVWEYFGEKAADDGAGTKWRTFESVAVSERAEERVAVDVSPSGPLEDHEVAGVAGKWIRMRLPAGATPEGVHSFSVRSISVGPTSDPHPFDHLLADDVPLSTEPDDDGAGEASDIVPFGTAPREGNVFYLASEDAFTKVGSLARITFERRDSGGEPSETQDAADAEPRTIEDASNEGFTDEPAVSWEYWNGRGWSRIRGLGDGTAGFTDGGEVTFEIPDDLEATTVAGHEGHWIRARLLGGFGEDYVESEPGRWRRVLARDPPRYESVTVRYESGAANTPAYVYAHNELTDERVDPEAERPFRPFRPLAEETQTLYLGFDRPFSGGPVQLFVDVEDRAFPPWFSPRVRWERANATDGTWIAVPASDGTAGLTERGIVGLSLSEPPAPIERFGTERNWIRARIRGTPFGLGDEHAAGDAESSESASAVAARFDGPSPARRFTGVSGGPIVAGDRRGGSRTALGVEGTIIRPTALEARREPEIPGTERRSRSNRGPEPCDVTVETTPPTGRPTSEPPALSGIYQNVGWARNVEAVDDELLGASDGDPGESFSVAETPVLDPAVRVDELNALSSAQRDALRSERPADVLEETDSDGSLRAFWVRWERVDSLIDAAGNDRVYALDPTDGVVEFGDGTRGKIPPRGTDNVRIEYVTGGGDAANVPPGAIEGLKSGLPFVEEVTNPISAIGGAPGEETEDVLERAPRALRDRNRAVAAADYERIARDTARIARARCLPGMNEAGDSAPGWVTVLVVPDDGSPRPEPATGVLEDVESELAERAPAGLLARDRLVVRGPSYVEVGISADVVADEGVTLGALEERVEGALAAFLNPLSGGEDGDGWRFGTLPGRSDAFALFDGVEGVDHVASLSVSFDDDKTVTSADGGGPPETSPDALVVEGDHDLRVVHGGRD